MCLAEVRHGPSYCLAATHNRRCGSKGCHIDMQTLVIESACGQTYCYMWHDMFDLSLTPDLSVLVSTKSFVCGRCAI